MTTRPPRIVGLTVGLAAAAVVPAAMVVLATRFQHAGFAAGAGVLALLFVAGACHVIRKLVQWRATIWIGSYLTQPRVHPLPLETLDVCFLFCDHYEPENGGVGADRQIARVRRWQEAYARAIEGHTDSDGRPPRHTWFFPVAEASPEVRPLIAQWPGLDWGEIEYHLHHDPAFDEREIRGQIVRDLRDLRQMGAVTGGRYGFVHGMFALAAGDPQYCKAPHEIDVLLETGCYADFTFPALETPAQPRQVNTIYYARSNGQRKPYDRGTPAEVGKSGEGLLMIPGPLWAGWSWRVLDEAHVAPTDPPHPHRIDHWLEAHVHVRGRANWVFIAVHSHTAKETVQDMLFSGPMQRLWAALEARFKRTSARLHYLTAREAFNIVKAAEAGRDGNPNDYRDYIIPAPASASGLSRVGDCHSSKGAP